MTNQQERDYERDGIPGGGPIACCDCYASEAESLILSALDDVADGGIEIADAESRQSIHNDIALKLAKALVHIRSTKRELVRAHKAGAQ